MILAIVVALEHMCFSCYPPPPNPCASGVALVTQTQATVPANRSRKTLGVGEVVTLTLDPTSPCSVAWSKTGNGTLGATSGNSITFTAHEREGPTTVSANIGGTIVRQVTFTVVEPQSESAVKTSEISIASGVAGAGMTLQITIAPTTVSFEKVESQEVPGPASSITDYFQQFSASQLAHSTTAGWVPIASGNLKFDNAGASGFQPPWSPGGGFQWVIPIQWRVINGSYIGTLPNRVQTFSITSNGTFTVSKMDRSVTRSP